MLPLAEVNKKQDISVHGYVDDTQLYIPLSPDDPRSIDALFLDAFQIEVIDGKRFVFSSAVKFFSMVQIL